MRSNFRRVVITITGTIILATGLVMIPYPGPGWLVVFFGLSVLASEYAWARNLLLRARGYYDSWLRWVAKQHFMVKLALWTLTAIVVIFTIWLINGYGFINSWLGLHQDWLVSPLFRA